MGSAESLWQHPISTPPRVFIDSRKNEERSRTGDLPLSNSKYKTTTLVQRWHTSTHPQTPVYRYVRLRTIPPLSLTASLCTLCTACSYIADR